MGVRYLLKYSGHRSLHLILPAEPFRACMPGELTQAKWNEQAAMLGRLLCRFVPPWTDGDVGKANDMVLTAPYSLHRFHGLISLPLTLEQAMAFDSASAAIQAFEGAALDGGIFEQDAEAAARLLELARRCQRDPAASLELAHQAFSTQRWKALAATMHASEGDGMTRQLMSGHVAAPFVQCGDSTSAARVPLAFMAMDDPANKRCRLIRMVRSVDWAPGEAVVLEFRQLTAAALAMWVEGGFTSLLEYTCRMAARTDYAKPILLAARLLTMAPETDQVRLPLLHQAYERLNVGQSPAAAAMLAVAAGSLAQGRVELLQSLARGNQPAEAQACVAILAPAGPWNVEDRPDLVLVVLALAFGRAMAERWIRGEADARGDVVMAGFFGDYCHGGARFHKVVAKSYGQIDREQSHAAN